MMKNNAMSTMLRSDRKKKATRREAEANARRKVAKYWDALAKGVKYRKATARVSCRRVTSQLKDELFEGILMNLQGKNGQKSHSAQKRVLRRIVEKRQAQQTHHNVGRTENRFSEHVSRHCVSASMKALRLYQMCV